MEVRERLRETEDYETTHLTLHCITLLFSFGIKSLCILMNCKSMRFQSLPVTFDVCLCLCVCVCVCVF